MSNFSIEAGVINKCRIKLSYIYKECVGVGRKTNRKGYSGRIEADMSKCRIKLSYVYTECVGSWKEDKSYGLFMKHIAISGIVVVVVEFDLFKQFGGPFL